MAGIKEMAELSGAYILSHPVRVSIVRLLRENKKMYTTKIAKALGLSDRLIAFHLSMLTTGGFVTSTYGKANPPNPPRIVRYYELTEKVDQTLDDFIKAFR